MYTFSSLFQNICNKVPRLHSTNDIPTFQTMIVPAEQPETILSWVSLQVVSAQHLSPWPSNVLTSSLSFIFHNFIIPASSLQQEKIDGVAAVIPNKPCLELWHYIITTPNKYSLHSRSIKRCAAQLVRKTFRTGKWGRGGGGSEIYTLPNSNCCQGQYLTAVRSGLINRHEKTSIQCCL